jgi:phage gp36-like protein
MAYCTETDIKLQIDDDILVQLTDDDDAGVIDSDIIVRSIADADAEIDSYCGTKYDVPFSTVPIMIRKISVDLSICRGDGPSADDDAGPEATTVKSDRVFSRGRDSDSSTGTLDNY